MASPTVVHLIPHTHWDREWYLPRAAFEARLVAMLDGLVPLLESHRALRFTLDGQTVLLADYFGVRPGMRSRVARLVRRGQLAVGPWYVLADELVPRAASLRKNLALGLADGRALGGAMRVLYSPDAFGHPHWLPSLAAEFGLRWAVLWRGLAGDPESGPDLYRWRAVAGRSLLVHHLPPDGYEIGGFLPGLGAAALRRAWPALRDRLVERSVTRHVAVPVGADHHAPHPRLAGLRERLGELDPATEFRWSRWEDYFRGVERSRPRLRTVVGELRESGCAWALQGVHAARARLKRRHGVVERALIEVAEPLARLAGGKAGVDRTAEVQRAWRRLVECQFHDTLAGTICDAVAREQTVRLDGVMALCDEIVAEGIARLAGHDPDRARAARPGAEPSLALWNPSARRHRGVVTADVPFFRRDVPVGPPAGAIVRRGPGAPEFALRRAGRIVPVQVLAVRNALDRRDARYHYPDLDRTDTVTVAFDPGLLASRRLVRLSVATGRSALPRPRHPVRGTGRRIENHLVRVSVGGTGMVTLLDRRADERYRGLLALHDDADRGDLYTPGIVGRPSSARPVIRDIELVARGPLVAALVVRWSLRSAGRGRMIGRTTLTLHAGSPTLRCRVELDNRARDHRLRMRLPVGVSDPVVAGAGTGFVERTAGREIRRSGEWQLPTAPARDFVAVGTRDRGLLLEHPGFFEYEATGPGVLWLTLLRGVGELSRARLAARPGHAAWPVATPDAQEPGAHTIDLALTPLSSLGSVRARARVSPFDTVLARSLR